MKKFTDEKFNYEFSNAGYEIYSYNNYLFIKDDDNMYPVVFEKDCIFENIEDLKNENTDSFIFYLETFAE